MKILYQPSYQQNMWVYADESGCYWPLARSMVVDGRTDLGVLELRKSFHEKRDVVQSAFFMEFMHPSSCHNTLQVHVYLCNVNFKYIYESLT